MLLSIFVRETDSKYLHYLLGGYQQSQVVHGPQGVQNAMGVDIIREDGGCLVCCYGVDGVYPHTYAQKQLWVAGLEAYFENFLGDD